MSRFPTQGNEPTAAFEEQQQGNWLPQMLHPFNPSFHAKTVRAAVADFPWGGHSNFQYPSLTAEDSGARFPQHQFLPPSNVAVDHHRPMSHAPFPEEYTRHWQTVHNMQETPPVQCQGCRASFPNWVALNSHISSGACAQQQADWLARSSAAAVPKALSCHLCGKVVGRHSNLMLHMSTKHSSNCEHPIVTMCGKCFQCVACNEQNMSDHHCNRTMASCPHCAQLVDSAEMNRHAHVQICFTCGRQFPCLNAFAGHWEHGRCLATRPQIPNTMIEPGEIVSNSENCKSDQFSPSLINEPLELLEAAQTSDSGPYVCIYCSKKINRRGNVDVHVRALHADIMVRCPTCCIYFYTNEQLEVHASHQQCSKPENFKEPAEKDFENTRNAGESSQCKEVSSTKYSKGGRRVKNCASNPYNQIFQCPVCNQPIKRKDNLMQHIRIKHKEMCPRCGLDEPTPHHSLSSQCLNCNKKFRCIGQRMQHQCIKISPIPY